MGHRLDVWLTQQLTGVSRSRVQSLIAEGQVILDGATAHASARLKAGQRVRVIIQEPVSPVPLPEPIPLPVVYQDAHLLVIDKPAGLVVHPGAGHPTGTLVNALLHHVRDLSGVGGVLRPGIVHRLDRGTSGLMVVAKDDPTHRALCRQFASHEVEKEYWALVLGVPNRQERTIRAAIGRDPFHRQRMSVRATRARQAETSYRVIEAFRGAALLRILIHTGRTHQIRVHLASIGHPVAGDRTYGGIRSSASMRPDAKDAIAALTRPALHAKCLAFRHPATGLRVSFTSPLPPDLQDVLDRLHVYH